MSGDRVNYGIDAPGLVRFFVMSGAVTLLATGVTSHYLLGLGSWAAIPIAGLAIVALYLLGMASLMVVWSKVVKVRERDRLFDTIAWRGDEVVLDVGCGRGLMLVGAARRLSTGYAVGIDIWAASDQSDNNPVATVRNAEIVGVCDRVRVETADMRSLPFADAEFDVIVSHWAVHNLERAPDRAAALTEMARVLRPGGAIVLADIAHREEYAATLAALGWGVQRRFGSPTRDAVLRAVSFGSFRPYAIVARGNDPLDPLAHQPATGSFTLPESSRSSGP